MNKEQTLFLSLHWLYESYARDWWTGKECRIWERRGHSQAYSNAYKKEWQQPFSWLISHKMRMNWRFSYSGLKSWLLFVSSSTMCCFEQALKALTYTKVEFLREWLRVTVLNHLSQVQDESMPSCGQSDT